jgi:hypothetical protein
MINDKKLIVSSNNQTLNNQLRDQEHIDFKSQARGLFPSKDISNKISDTLDNNKVLKESRIHSDKDIKMSILQKIWVAIRDFFSDNRALYGTDDAHLMIMQMVSNIHQLDVSLHDINTDKVAIALMNSIQQEAQNRTFNAVNTSKQDSINKIVNNATTQFKLLQI